MPVEWSIGWKPLRDSHYVVASLQANDGGRRRIFVRQTALSRAEAVSHATQGRWAFGLLVGQFYQCSETGIDYLVIDSLVEAQYTLREDELPDAAEKALAQTLASKVHLLGWYCSAPQVEAKPSPIVAAVHRSLFPQPWQPVLVLADRSDAPNGAFFLYDSANSRWFHAPFYEVPDYEPTGHEAKTTYVDWPDYITMDTAVLAHRETVTAPRHAASPPTVRSYDRRAPSSLSLTGDRAHPAPLESIEGPARSLQPVTPEVIGSVSREVADVPPSPVPDNGSRAASAERHTDLGRRLLGRPVEKLPIADDRDQGRGQARDLVQRVSDDEDTSHGDSPARYVELARSEGFFVAARYDTLRETGFGETLWVLNDPYSGMLLTIATTDTEVLDASLHYNLHTDDAGLRRTPFPEHRDPDSQTIYMRESCVDGLRARCRNVRATNALEREWKVSPEISFLTPGEWECVASGQDAQEDARRIKSLNQSRIRGLPDGVRHQFGLTSGDEPA